jgi:hypothetical protein
VKFQKVANSPIYVNLDNVDYIEVVDKKTIELVFYIGGQTLRIPFDCAGSAYDWCYHYLGINKPIKVKENTERI